MRPGSPEPVTGGRSLTIFLIVACGMLAGLGIALLPALLADAATI